MDPIGVSDVPGARDEYYSYLPQVFSMLLQNVDERKIADYLGKVSLLSMGLPRKAEHDLKIARTLIDWKEEIMD